MGLKKKKKKKEREVVWKVFWVLSHHSKLKKLNLSDENWDQIFWVSKTSNLNFNVIVVILVTMCTCRVGPSTLILPLANGHNFSLSHFISSHFRVSEVLISFLNLSSWSAECRSNDEMQEAQKAMSVGAMLS